MRNTGKNFSSIITSAAALLAILIVGAGITYSWIEGGSTYTIKTDNENSVKTATAPSQTVYDNISLDPSSTGNVDLTKLDANTGSSGELIFSQASSADGEKFFFPTAYADGTPTAYREADTNDIGTKLINYSFNVTASKKCYLAFAAKPTVTFVNGSELTDEELASFRLMIKSGSDRKILNLTDKAITDSAVTSASGSTAAVDTQSANGYIFSEAHSNKLFEYSAGTTETITVSVWLDGASAPSSLIGKEVRVNMNLKAAAQTYKVKIYVEPGNGYDSYYAYGYNETVSSNTYEPFGDWSGTKMTLDSDTGYHYVINNEITDTFNFIVNNGSDTQYPQNNSQTTLPVNFNGEPDGNGYYTYVLKSDNTWRAFDDTKITVNAQACYFNNDGTKKSDGSAACGTVQAGGNTAGATSSKVVYFDDGSGKVSLTAAAGAHYRFDGWYFDEGCEADNASNDLNYDYSVANKTTPVTLYAKFTELPKYGVTIGAVTYDYQNAKVKNGFTGGGFTIGSTQYTAQYQGSYYSDEKVTATANANTHYTFAGWYSDADCKNLVSTDAVLNQNISGSSTFYAKFEEEPKYTINVAAKTYPTTITEQGGSVSINSNGTSYTGYGGDVVTLNAAAASGFRFDGWYSDESCQNAVGSASVTISESLNGATYYAKFVKQYTVTFTARTNDIESSDGGTVRMYKFGAGAPEYFASQTLTVDANTTIVLEAQANNGYLFSKITDASGSDISVTPTATQIINSDITYYADFITNTNYATTTIYFEPWSGWSNHYAYVYNENDTSKVYSGEWCGAQMSIDEATGYYKYEFKTTDTGSFRVIVNNGVKNDGSQYPANVEGQNSGLLGDIGKTYLFRSNNPTSLEEFDPSTRVNITLNAVTFDSSGNSTVGGFAGGKITVGSNEYTSEYSSIYTVNDAVTAEAAANIGYTFGGWYSDAGCSNQVTANAALSQAVTGSATYYAKFTENTSKELYLKPNNNWKSDDARFAMYVFNDTENINSWVSMESVGNDYYKAAVPDGNYTKVIFVRMNGATTENDWKNKWNQTGDLTIPTNGNNCFTLDEGEWDGATKTWGVYPH